MESYAVEPEPGFPDDALLDAEDDPMDQENSADKSDNSRMDNITSETEKLSLRKETVVDFVDWSAEVFSDEEDKPGTGSDSAADMVLKPIPTIPPPEV